MAEITAALVKELRETSGAGMMDCKRALQESDGDMEAAIDWLRTKGLSKAAKKADRVAAEGLIAVATSDDGKTASVVEVNAETDFVSRNELFQNAASVVAKAALASDDVEKINESKTEGGETISAMLTNLIATIGENMMVRRAKTFTVSEGAVAKYMHNAITPELGRLGVLVAVEGAGDRAALEDLGRKVAMHVAATNPLALSTDELDPAVVEKEKAILTEQASESGKPAQVVEKMVEGRMRKYFQEVVLLQQAFVMNPDQTVQQFVDETAKSLGSPIKVTGFVRLALGEGVEKKEDDFAAEVAAMSGN